MTNVESEQIEIRIVSSRNVEWTEPSDEAGKEVRRSQTLEWNDDLNRYEAKVMMWGKYTLLVGYFPKDEIAA